MEAKDFNAELCAGIVNRLNTQHVKGKVTRQKRAIEILCGAAYALHIAKSEHYNSVSWLAVMVATRGMEVVEKTARGEPL